MLSTQHINRANNCLRMTFSASSKTNGTPLNFPTWQVPLTDYNDRFDPARPVYVALEGYTGENSNALYEINHVCFDTLHGSSWSSTPSLATSLGAAYRQNLSRSVASDTIGIPMNRAMLAGGTWQFSMRDVGGELTQVADLDLGYTFTIILYQKYEGK